jgi:Tol biopolymer transport system component
LALAVALAVAHSANATFPGTNGKIAFVRSGDIWTMNADGTNRIQVTSTGSASAPSWRPDGQAIAYIRSATYSELGTLIDPGGIEIVSPSGAGPPQRLLEDPSVMPMGLSWSPNCSSLAFGHQDDSNDPSEHIWTVNATTGAATQLTTGVTLDRSPDFSPDGTKIAFTSTRHVTAGANGSTNHLLYVMKSDGTGATRLTTLSDPNGSLHERNPSWKPDGSAIAIRSDTDFGENGDRGPIVAVSADGSTRAGYETAGGLLVGANPVWSPDGTKIVVGSLDRSAGGIGLYDTGTQTMTTLSSDGREPDWVPSNGSCGGATDTVGPTLTVPADLAIDATSPSGAVVQYTATATDNVDPAPTIKCLPASLGVFAIGDTTVSCTAKDAAGNIATKTFKVHVRGALEQLGRLATRILADPGIEPRIRTILAGQVQVLANTLARGVLPARLICAQSSLLTLEVRALPPVLISPASRSSIVTDLIRIRAVMGC